MKKIALVGCTGSIGTQTADIVRRYPDRFSLCALAARRRSPALARLAEEFHPKQVYTADDGPMSGDFFSECDLAFIAASGFSGLSYTLKAIEAGKPVALANKESLVAGGQLVTEAAARRNAEIIPVDSEHSAIFQALGMRRTGAFSRIILTASGGPFRTFSAEQLARVTAADALCHPTWKMGKKVTVDSATLLNKGYEVIEAKWLYGVDFSHIKAVVHPESIVHSVVCFEDGAALAQLGYPDMRVPIQLALTYPDRLPCERELDFESLGTLHFERLPAERFPCFGLALEAGKAGKTAPAVLNGAAEIAVEAFLGGRISFPQIADTIKDALSRIPMSEVRAYGDVAEADRRAREEAKRYVNGL